MPFMFGWPLSAGAGPFVDSPTDRSTPGPSDVIVLLAVRTIRSQRGLKGMGV